MQYFATKFKIFIVLFAMSQLLQAQTKSKVEIVGADLFEGQVTPIGNSKKLSGNVVLKQYVELQEPGLGVIVGVGVFVGVGVGVTLLVVVGVTVGVTVGVGDGHVIQVAQST